MPTIIVKKKIKPTAPVFDTGRDTMNILTLSLSKASVGQFLRIKRSFSTFLFFPTRGAAMGVAATASGAWLDRLMMTGGMAQLLVTAGSCCCCLVSSSILVATLGSILPRPTSYTPLYFPPPGSQLKTQNNVSTYYQQCLKEGIFMFTFYFSVQKCLNIVFDTYVKYCNTKIC